MKSTLVASRTVAVYVRTRAASRKTVGILQANRFCAAAILPFREMVASQILPIVATQTRCALLFV